MCGVCCVALLYVVMPCSVCFVGNMPHWVRVVCCTPAGRKFVDTMGAQENKRCERPFIHKEVRRVDLPRGLATRVSALPVSAEERAVNRTAANKRPRHTASSWIPSPSLPGKLDVTGSTSASIITMPNEPCAAAAPMCARASRNVAGVHARVRHAPHTQRRTPEADCAL